MGKVGKQVEAAAKAQRFKKELTQAKIESDRQRMLSRLPGSRNSQNSAGNSSSLTSTHPRLRTPREGIEMSELKTSDSRTS